LPRSQYYYDSVRDDQEVIDALQDLAFRHPSYGFRKLYAYIRRSGQRWNHKKVYRVYKLLRLNKKRKVIEQRGKPSILRADNGPEFTSKDLELWAKDRCITIQYIQPGKPMQNGYIERFNRVYREAILDAYLFFDLYQVKQLTEEWMEEYNQRRPHEALNNLSPREWSNRATKEEITNQ